MAVTRGASAAAPLATGSINNKEHNPGVERNCFRMRWEKWLGRGGGCMSDVGGGRDDRTKRAALSECIIVIEPNHADLAGRESVRRFSSKCWQHEPQWVKQKQALTCNLYSRWG